MIDRHAPKLFLLFDSWYFACRAI